MQIQSYFTSLNARRVALAASSMLLVAGCNNQPAALAPESPAKPAMAGPNPAQTHTATNTPLPMPARPMMSPATMPVPEPMVLRFNESSIKAIQAGTKTATIRKGVRTFTGPVRAVGTAGNIVILDGVTTLSKKMSELTETDAKANGSASLDVLKTQLMKDYPAITPDDVVTVIGFKAPSKSM